MDLRKLKTLIDLVSESNISELEITEADGKVKIVKADPRLVLAPQHYAVPSTMMMAGGDSAGAVAAAAAAAAASSEAARTAEAAALSENTVTSPMVGTFYRASSPGGKPLVDVGSVVEKGDAICIIEAMKIMNEIEADRAGTVQRVMCDNGQAVEFGQPLFVID